MTLSVLQISHGIYPFRQAGTEIYTAELAAALVYRGIRLTVAIPALRRNECTHRDLMPECVRSIALAPGGWWGNKARYAKGHGPLWQDEIRRCVREANPDVIQVHHAIGFGINLLAILEQSGIPVIITLPDYWLLCPGILRRCGGDAVLCAKECCRQVGKEKYLAGGARTYVARRREKVRGFIDRVNPWMAAISESTRGIFEAAGFGGQRLLTHKWGIDVASFRRTATPAFARNMPRIGYLGSVRSHKGCHVLAQAFKLLRVPSSLHFHGTGDALYLATLRKDCVDLSVYFHGRFDHASVAAILADLDVIVVPSLWEETYCLVAQEAMAARKPLIATNVGGLADRIIHGVNGFLVPPGDAAALAAQLSVVLSRLPEISQALDYERCLVDIKDDARQWIDLYKTAIAEGRRPLSQA